jgi:5-methylcytosine-specific restriction protein B
MEITKGIHIASDGKESIEFVKVENIAEPITYTNLQNIRGLESCEPLINNQGSLFKLTEEEYEIILSAIEDLQPELPKTNPSYSFEDLHNDLGIKKKTLETWLEAIRAKKQAIFFGPPGTGKTFIVKHLAKYLIQDGLGFSEIVQFHPTYSYEDFIQGIRPIIDNGNLVFELRDGKLLTFCKKAQQTNDFSVLVIDEINRANLSKVFGELMYLLEYRDEKVSLSSGIDFSIPNNVLIIGTMNTADRSIALVDFALRRRFAFIELEPNYDLLKSFLDSSELKKVDIYELVDLLRSINSKIEDKNYFLGTSFFLNKELDKYLKTIWKMEIEPYLEEYFFANPELVDQFRWEKVKAKVLL